MNHRKPARRSTPRRGRTRAARPKRYTHRGRPAYTRQQVARALGVHPWRIRQAHDEGLITPCRIVGKRRLHLYDAAQVEALRAHFEAQPVVAARLSWDVCRAIDATIAEAGLVEVPIDWNDPHSLVACIRRLSERLRLLSEPSSAE
ncbi:MAG: hypothetical protein R3B72_51895 [Polyangiaceae bacterium]